MTNPFGDTVTQLLKEASGSIPYNLPDESIYLESVRGLRSELDTIIAAASPSVPTEGGTGLTTYVVGDILYASDTDILSALAGNVTTTKKFLTQTGDSIRSAAPGWATIVNSDIAESTVTQHEAALTILASQVDMAVINTPAFTTSQHLQDVFHSSGWISGGVISNDGSANIDVKQVRD